MDELYAIGRSISSFSQTRYFHTRRIRKALQVRSLCNGGSQILRVERWVSSKGVSNLHFAVKISVMIVVLFIEFSIKMIIYSTFDSSFWPQMGYWVIGVYWCVSSSMFFYKNVNLGWIYDKMSFWYQLNFIMTKPETVTNA